MKKSLAIFTGGVVMGALIGHIHPTIACLFGIIIGIGIGYVASLLHLVFSKIMLEQEMGDEAND